MQASYLLDVRFFEVCDALNAFDRLLYAVTMRKTLKIDETMSKHEHTHTH